MAKTHRNVVQTAGARGDTKPPVKQSPPKAEATPPKQQRPEPEVCGDCHVTKAANGSCNC